MGSDPFSKDLWLGEQLGKPAWSVNTAALESPNQLCDFVDTLRGAGRPFFVQSRVAVLDLQGIRLLQKGGLFLVDTNVVLEKNMEPDWKPAQDTVVRLADAGDEESVRRIAANSFSVDRFHIDPEVGQDVADALQGAWAANYFKGARGDWMGVAEISGRVVGFLSLLLAPDLATIDLIAVEEAAQGRGAGRALVGFAQQSHPVVPSLRVGTQAANAASIRFYNRCGFQYQKADYIFHLHG